MTKEYVVKTKKWVQESGGRGAGNISSDKGLKKRDGDKIIPNKGKNEK